DPRTRRPDDRRRQARAADDEDPAGVLRHRQRQEPEVRPLAHQSLIGKTMSAPSLDQTTVTITASDLPLFCPPKNAPLWSQHPRVFLEIEEDGEILCPYCST